MAHIIILGKINTLQGTNVTGTGTLERLKQAVIAGGAWEVFTPPTAAIEQVAEYLDQINDAMDTGMTVADVETMAANLEELNSKCP